MDVRRPKGMSSPSVIRPRLLGPQQRRAEVDPVGRGVGETVIDHRGRDEVELQVGVLGVRPPHEGTGLADRRGQGAPTGHHPAEQMAEHRRHALDIVEGVAAFDLEDDRGNHMVLEVAADTRQIGDHGDPEPVQMLGRTKAREHQELRRLDRASGEDHLAIRAIFDDGVLDERAYTQCPLPVEHQPEGRRAGLDREVRPLAHRVEKRTCGAAPSAATLGDLVEAKPFLGRTVEIGVSSRSRARGPPARRRSTGDSENADPPPAKGHRPRGTGFRRAPGLRAAERPEERHSRPNPDCRGHASHRSPRACREHRAWR